MRQTSTLPETAIKNQKSKAHWPWQASRRARSWRFPCIWRRKQDHCCCSKTRDGRENQQGDWGRIWRRRGFSRWNPSSWLCQRLEGACLQFGNADPILPLKLLNPSFSSSLARRRASLWNANTIVAREMHNFHLLLNNITITIHIHIGSTLLYTLGFCRLGATIILLFCCEFVAAAAAEVGVSKKQ